MTEYEDMSPWAVHFAGPSRSRVFPDAEPSGYHTIMSILYDRFVRPVAEPHGASAEIASLAERNRPACFSEVPLHLLDRIVEHRSAYGIGFAQRFLRSEDGGRVWYVEDDGAPASAVRDLVAEHQAGGAREDDPLWGLTPFIDLATTRTAFGDYLWEREWRVPGGLRFEPADVAFLFIPEEFHESARGFFETSEVEQLGPSYLCPYIDVTWDRDRIVERLSEASEG